MYFPLRKGETWVSFDTKSKQSINLEKLLMTAEEWEHIKVRGGGGTVSVTARLGWGWGGGGHGKISKKHTEG